MPQNDQDLLLRLQQQNVEFVIIGGVCSVLHGVSLLTQDLDICCRFTPDNLRKIEAAVKDLHPRHRLAANKIPLELTDELCARLNNLYLQTDFGTLDCVGDVAGIGDYDKCLQRSMVHEMSYGQFRILDLDAIIAAKEAVARDKDMAAVKQLRAIKEKLSAPSKKPQSEI